MFALIIFMEASKPKPINWFPSYATNHTIPYGTFVFTEEFKKLFTASFGNESALF